MSFTITKAQIQEGLKRHGIYGGSEDYLLLGSVAVEALDEMKATIDSLLQNVKSQKQTHDALVALVREVEKDRERLDVLEKFRKIATCHQDRGNGFRPIEWVYYNPTGPDHSPGEATETLRDIADAAISAKGAE